jgi:hypothetical protein
MEGVLPAEISHLSELIHIDVSDNEIDGGIPPSWVNLKNLGKLLTLFLQLWKEGIFS